MKCPRCASRFGYRFLFCPYDGKQLLPEAPSLEPSGELPDLAGTNLESRYRICEILGEGSVATVYLAENVQSAAPVAIKMLDRNRVGDGALVDRFRREAEAIAQLDHPNIVRLFETGELPDGTPFLVLERLSGETLGAALDAEGELPLEVALPLLRQAAAALWAVHERGMVHRDVKPANLFLVGRAGQLREVKVLGFGLSHLWKSSLTQEGTVIGTPHYIAPEQVVGEPTDQRTDVYALGMVMYRMMTGRPAFEGGDELSVLARQLLELPPAPREIIPDLDSRCDLVIRTATRKRPEARYASMKLFAEDLKRLEQPKASLWAREAMVDPYEPTTVLGAEVMGSMARLLAEGYDPVPDEP